MPEFHPNTRFSDCWSSVGDVTFYHRYGKCFWRSKSRCLFKGTAEQMRTADVHRRALAAWRELPHSVQLQWNEYAREVPPHRPPFDGRGHITGHNLFVSAYHGFAQMGNEHVPEPVKWRPVPVFDVHLLSMEDTDGSLVMRFQVKFIEPTRSAYRLHAKIQLTKPSEGLNPGKMRVFIAEGICGGEVSEVTVTIPEYKTLWNLDAQACKAHCRFTLIDIASGYRSGFIGRFYHL